MLILSRKLYETLVIGDNITITILEMTGGAVRIGINSPKGGAIARERVCQKEKFKYKNFLDAICKILSRIYRNFTDLHLPIFLLKSK